MLTALARLGGAELSPLACSQKTLLIAAAVASTNAIAICERADRCAAAATKPTKATCDKRERRRGHIQFVYVCDINARIG